MTYDRLSQFVQYPRDLMEIVADECYLRAERTRHYGTDLPLGKVGQAMAMQGRRNADRRLRRVA